MHACPACGAATISSWVKLSLGPARSVRCRRCAAQVSVALIPALVMLMLMSLAFPLSLFLPLWLDLRSPGLILLVVAGVLVGLAVAYLRWVPLVQKSAE